MSKRYSLDGVNLNLEFGKNGLRVVSNGTKFTARDAADAVNVRMAGLAAVDTDDFVIKSQLDAAITGLFWHEPAQLGSVASVNLAAAPATFDGGSAPSGVGARILIREGSSVNPGSSSIDNGIYAWNGAGVAMTRVSDMAAASDAEGSAVFVTEGATLADIGFVETEEPGIVGTDTLTFTQFTAVVGSVTSVTSVGAGASLVATGGPAVTIRSLESTDSSLAFTVSGSEVDGVIAPLGVTTAAIAAGAVTQPKIAALDGTFWRRAAFVFGTSSPFNIGASTPASSTMVQTRVNVTTAWDVTGTSLTVGDAGTPAGLMGASDVDLERAGLYIVDNDDDGFAGTQLQGVLNSGVGPGAGAATVLVQYLVFA